MITLDELKRDLVQLFGLEEIEVSSIPGSEQLFGDGLGLDSVDAIELSIYLENRHGIVIENLSDAADIFATFDTLRDYINTQNYFANKLPHQQPVRSLSKVVASNQLDAAAVATFKHKPSLAKIVEAAAQTSVFMKLHEFKSELGIPLDKQIKGMLLKMRASKTNPIDAGDVYINTEYVANYRYFFDISFEVRQLDLVVAKGNINILLEGEDGAS